MNYCTCLPFACFKFFIQPTKNKPSEIKSLPHLTDPLLYASGPQTRNSPKNHSVKDKINEIKKELETKDLNTLNTILSNLRPVSEPLLLTLLQQSSLSYYHPYINNSSLNNKVECLNFSYLPNPLIPPLDSNNCNSSKYYYLKEDMIDKIVNVLKTKDLNTLSTILNNLRDSSHSDY